MTMMTEARERAVVTRFITNAQKGMVKEINTGQKNLLDFFEQQQTSKLLSSTQTTLDDVFITKFLSNVKPGKIKNLYAPEEYDSPEAVAMATAPQKDKSLIDKLLTGGEFTEGNKILAKGTIASIALLTGILGTLNQVPSILQASLKITKIGFLLILKPLADMIGNILMIIGKFLLKIGIWAMKLTGIEKILFGLGTLLGLIIIGLTSLALAGVASGAITSIGGIGAASLIALKLFGVIIVGITGGLLLAWTAIKSLSKITNLLSIGWGILKDWIYKFADSIEEKHPLIAKFVRLLGDGAGFMESLTSNMSTVFDDLTTFGGALKVLSGFINILTLGKAGEKYDPYGRSTMAYGSVWDDKSQSYVEAANGGIFNRPTRALIGEAGPEAVIPLSKMDEVTGSGSITMNINGIFDENRIRDIMSSVAEEVLYKHKQVSGSVF